MKVFITGATGFVGRYLTERCLENNFEVSIFTRKSNLDNKSRFLEKVAEKGAEIYYGDLRNFDDVKNTLREDLDIVFHLASDPRHDRKSYEVDINGTKNLLRAISENDIGVKKIVFLSTASVYGPQKVNKPIDEKTKCKPKTFYELSKYKAENIIKRFCKKNDMDYVILRPTRIYGPGDWQKTFLDYIKLQKLGISFVLDKLFFNLIYVKNLVHYIFLSLKSKNEVFIASDERPYTFEEIDATISSLMKLKPKVRIIVPRSLILLASRISGRFAYSVNDVRFSVEKARKRLGYRDLYTLREGLRETIEWYKNEGFL